MSGTDWRVRGSGPFPLFSFQVASKDSLDAPRGSELCQNMGSGPSRAPRRRAPVGLARSAADRRQERLRDECQAPPGMKMGQALFIPISPREPPNSNSEIPCGPKTLPESIFRGPEAAKTLERKTPQRKPEV